MPPVLLRPAPLRPSPRRAPRAGRLLVEVLIAMVLLAVAASASLSLIRTQLALTDRIAFLTASRTVTRSLAEQLQSSACTVTAGTSQDGRTGIAWTPAVSGSLVTLAVAAQGAAHPSGLVAPRALSAELAGWCP
jgi:Tfp pilus assembly protein PilV